MRNVRLGLYVFAVRRAYIMSFDATDASQPCDVSHRSSSKACNPPSNIDSRQRLSSIMARRGLNYDAHIEPIRLLCIFIVN